MNKYNGLLVRDDKDRLIVDECTWHYEQGLEEAGYINTMVDIGCHIGAFIYHVKRDYPLANVIGVDPDEDSIRLAIQNVGDMPNVTLINRAVGYGNGQLSLEDTVGDTVDLLKIDCEGAEYNIIPNVKDETWGKVRVVIGEYHGAKDRFIKECEPFLEKHFEVSYIPPYNKHLGFFLGVSRYAD